MALSARFSRRRFLSTAAAAAVAPYVIPSGVLAAEKRAGANDRIGIGYIGAGRRAHQLMGLPKDGQIVAAADAYLPRAEEVATKNRGKAYQDYRKLLESRDVDAVFIATPDHWRALATIHACQAGKDVYGEKPMTLTIREGRLMTDAVRKYNRVFQTGSQQRSMAVNRVACQAVRDGLIGKIKMVIASNYPSPWECDLPEQPVPEGLDWDMWCGPTEVVPFHNDIFTPRANPGWISFRPWSGGEVTGWGAHGLDQIQWALGMCKTGPVEIWTEGPALKAPVYSKPESRKRGEELCQKPSVLYRYANGVTVKLDKGPGGGAIFIGEKGTITIDRGIFKSDPKEIAEAAIKESGIRVSQSENHIGDWFDAMKSRQEPIADVEIGHRSSTVCHLINIARWLGRKLQWDPDKEQFIDDDEANKLVDRPRRKPYELPEQV